MKKLVLIAIIVIGTSSCHHSKPLGLRIQLMLMKRDYGMASFSGIRFISISHGIPYLGDGSYRIHLDSNGCKTLEGISKMVPRNGHPKWFTSKSSRWSNGKKTYMSTSSSKIKNGDTTSIWKEWDYIYDNGQKQVIKTKTLSN